MQLIRKIVSLKRFRFLLSQLVKRDFKIKYRGSVLGILWSVLNPLLNMLVLSIVFENVFGTKVDYKIYLLAGLTLFNFFSEATNLACSSIVSNIGMITKVYFPRLIFPTSKVLTATIGLLISTAVYIILGCFMGIYPSWSYLLIPFVLFCILLFSLGIGYILSTMYVFFRDTMHLYSVLLMIWMYATPIMYTIDILPKNIIPILAQNPLNQFIEFFRTITIYHASPNLSSYLICLAWGIGMFILGTVFFVKNQDKFIYYV